MVLDMFLDCKIRQNMADAIKIVVAILSFMRHQTLKYTCHNSDQFKSILYGMVFVKGLEP
jgi:hypothetical protein